MSKKTKTLDELLDELEYVDDQNRNVVFIKLGSIIRTQKGKKPKELFDFKENENFVPYVNIDLMSGANKNDIQYADKNGNVVLCNEQDVLMVWDGARSGFVGRGVSGIIGSTLSKIEIPLIYNDYLYHFLKFNFEYLNKNTKGSGIPHVDPLVLNEIEFPLYSLSEQKRIANKIDTLFSKIDEAKRLIEEARETFELRRAAIFKKVYGDSKEIEAHYWKTIGELFHVQIGSTPSRKVEEYWEGTNPWLSSGEVNFNRITDSKEKVTDLAVTEARLKLAPKGSILFGMIGEGKTRGQVAILDMDSYHNQNTASIWVSETNIPTEYVYFWLVSKYTENRQNSSGNNQPAYNKARVQALTIPIYDEKTMKEKVQLLNKLATLEKQVRNLLDKEVTISNLKQSILSKAFKGELGTNDPTDEPAIELLKSILQEKL